MKVTKNQIDELNATLTINVENSDISENVDKSIREYRRKANVPGFRPGNVPVGLIKKMYGNAIIAEELNKIVSQSLSDYLVEEKLNILGEPLPSEAQEQIDFNSQESFDFIFDIGLSPEFEVKLSKKDKVNKYQLKVDDDMKKKYIDSYQERFGTFEDSNKSDKDSLLTCDLIQIDDKEAAVVGGITTEEASVSIKMIKDKKIQKLFIGIENGTIVDFDLKKAFPNDTEIAALLKIEKEQVTDMTPLYRATIKTVKRFKNAELNQEFYDKCFGDKAVKNEEEFNNRVVEDIKASFVRESKYKLMLDIKEKLTKKFDVKVPEDFLKRWLKATNKDITAEQLENEFPKFIEDLAWTLIKGKIAKENELKVEKEDLIEAAKHQLMAQFSQYGMSHIPDEYLNKYAEEMLQKEEEANKLYEQEIEVKVVDFIEQVIKTDEKIVSVDEFQEMFK